MNDRDVYFMRRAIQIAQFGLGTVSPNPLVGCVIVHGNSIIGEGWHQQYGEAHAEVNAITNVNDQSLLKNSTAYVTLEPCSHHGKTPPCADLLISKGLKRVVIANKDPFHLVDGHGINKLSEAGINVECDVLKDEAFQINRRFLTAVNKKRPYIILKWAQTADGYIARKNFDSKWISNKYSRKLVHKWRAEEDAILVGTNTARYDNPRLNVRNWKGKDPLRIVMDSELRLDASLALFDKIQPTLVYNNLKSYTDGNLEFMKIENSSGLKSMMDDLYTRRVHSIIIEGGSQTLQKFIEEDLWDEARVFTSPTKFDQGIPAPTIGGQIIDKQMIGEDTLKFIRNQSS